MYIIIFTGAVNIKEDHNKERHYNELTQRSVAREYDLARGGKVDVIREDVFREEVIIATIIF